MTLEAPCQVPLAKVWLALRISKPRDMLHRLNSDGVCNYCGAQRHPARPGAGAREEARRRLRAQRPAHGVLRRKAPPAEIFFLLADPQPFFGFSCETSLRVIL